VGGDGNVGAVSTIEIFRQAAPSNVEKRKMNGEGRASVGKSKSGPDCVEVRNTKMENNRKKENMLQFAVERELLSKHESEQIPHLDCGRSRKVIKPRTAEMHDSTCGNKRRRSFLIASRKFGVKSDDRRSLPVRNDKNDRQKRRYESLIVACTMFKTRATRMKSSGRSRHELIPRLSETRAELQIEIVSIAKTLAVDVVAWYSH